MSWAKRSLHRKKDFYSTYLEVGAQIGCSLQELGYCISFDCLHILFCTNFINASLYFFFLTSHKYIDLVYSKLLQEVLACIQAVLVLPGFGQYCNCIRHLCDCGFTESSILSVFKLLGKPSSSFVKQQACLDARFKTCFRCRMYV